MLATMACLNPGGYSQKNWLGVCGPLPKTLTLFMTKICDIPYPIYDLTKNATLILLMLNILPYLAKDALQCSIDPSVVVIGVAFFQEVYGRLGNKPDKLLIESYEHFVLESPENLKASRMLKVTISRWI